MRLLFVLYKDLGLKRDLLLKMELMDSTAAGPCLVAMATSLFISIATDQMNRFVGIAKNTSVFFHSQAIF